MSTPSPFASTAERITSLENQVKSLQDALSRPESDSSLFVPRSWHEAMLNNVKAQLPEGMEHCTIEFKECPRGHGSLTAKNWTPIPCRQCAIDDLGARVNALAEANTELGQANTHLAAQVERLSQANRSLAELNDRLVEQNAGLIHHVNEIAAQPADEFGVIGIHDRDPRALARGVVVRSHSSLVRLEAALHRHRQHRQLHNLPPTLENIIEHSTGHIAVDDLGPITQDDLDASALRDGKLRRSSESREKLETITRRSRIQATLDDEEGDPDVTPQKANPNHVQNDLDHRHGALNQLRDAERIRSHFQHADASGEAGPHLVVPPEVLDGGQPISDELENRPTEGTDGR